MAAQRKATGCAVVGCVVIALIVTLFIIGIVASTGNNNGQSKPRSTTSDYGEILTSATRHRG